MDRKRPTNSNNKNKRKSITFEDDDFIFSEAPLNQKEQKILGVKSEYMVFYIAIAVVGVIVAFVLALSSLNFFSRNATVPPGLSVNQQTPPDPDADLLSAAGPDENFIAQSFLGLITALDVSGSAIQIHDVLERGTSTFFVQPSTDMRGRFNNALVLNEFRVGDIVDVSFNPDNNHLSRVSISTNADIWENRYTGLEVNTLNNTITVDDKMFVYNTNTIIINDGMVYPVTELHPLSMVSMRGIGNTVWFIESIQGFGTLRVTGSEAIMGGFLEVGREGTIPLGEDVSPLDQELAVSEGIHRVVIHGDNIANEIREVTITSGQTEYLDLSDIEITRGHLIINASIENAIITLNGMPITSGEPNPLPFGDYRVIVQYPGYLSFDETVTFEEHNQNVMVVLVPEPPSYDNIVGGGGGVSGDHTQVVTGRQEIRTEPAGAHVFVDNVFLGTSPVTAQLELGQRTVTVQLDGFNSTTHTIMVSNTNLPVIFELQPSPNLPQPGIGGNNNNNPNLDNSLPIIDTPANTPSTVVPPSNTPTVPDQSNNNPPSGVIMPVTPDEINTVPLPNN